MRQATALGLKLAAYLVIFGVTRPLLGPLPANMILAAVHTLLLWMADLAVLPRFGNTVATLCDTVVLFIGTFLVAGALDTFIRTGVLCLAVAAGTAFEWWFHRWLEAAAVIE